VWLPANPLISSRHVGDLLGVEPDRWFVEDQDLGIVQQSLRQPHPLLVPLRELADDAAPDVADAATSASRRRAAPFAAPSGHP